MLEAASAAMPASGTLRLMTEFDSTADGCWSSRDVNMRNSRCTHAAKGSPTVEKSEAAPASGSVTLRITYPHRSANSSSFWWPAAYVVLGDTVGGWISIAIVLQVAITAAV